MESQSSANCSSKSTRGTKTQCLTCQHSKIGRKENATAAWSTFLMLEKLSPAWTLSIKEMPARICTVRRVWLLLWNSTTIIRCRISALKSLLSRARKIEQSSSEKRRSRNTNCGSRRSKMCSLSVHAAKDIVLLNRTRRQRIKYSRDTPSATSTTGCWTIQRASLRLTSSGIEWLQARISDFRWPEL